MTDDTLEQVEGFKAKEFLTDFGNWLEEGDVETSRNRQFSFSIIHASLGAATAGAWILAIIGYYIYKFVKQSDEEYMEVKEYKEVEN